MPSHRSKSGREPPRSVDTDDKCRTGPGDVKCRQQLEKLQRRRILQSSRRRDGHEANHAGYEEHNGHARGERSPERCPGLPQEPITPRERGESYRGGEPEEHKTGEMNDHERKGRGRPRNQEERQGSEEPDSKERHGRQNSALHRRIAPGGGLCHEDADRCPARAVAIRFSASAA